VARNVFLSFAMEDQLLVTLFRGQAKNGRLSLEFRDYSIKEPFDSAWKTNCERILRQCSATMCLVGTQTNRSAAVDWELRKSRELGLGLMAVRLDSAVTVYPRALAEFGVNVLPWDIARIMNELEQITS